LYDPIHKRGKAKKFSYQYKGPYEVEQKISSLIYKIRMTVGSSTIVHVNLLKRAHGQEKENGPAVKERCSLEPPTVKSEENLDIPSRVQLREFESDDYDEIEETDVLLDNSSSEADWTPGSLYLQRKLLNDKTADDVTYELRSRRVGRSGPEIDKDKGKETSEQTGNRLVQPSALFNKNMPELTHSYNLRSRVGATS